MDINSRYQIEDCVEWISKNGYRKVVLQFSEAEMSDSVQVVKLLKQFLPSNEFYTVVSASCTVDYLAPLRLGEKIVNAIICYGSGQSKTNLCLPSSTTAFDHLPVLYVFGSNQEVHLMYTIQSKGLILYDLKFMPYLSDFLEKNCVQDDQVGKVIRMNENWSFTKCADRFVTDRSSCRLPFGHFSITEPVDYYDQIYWIGHCDNLFYQVNLAKDKIILIDASVQPYPSMDELRPRTILSRRLALIEKARLASTIGLVFNHSIPDVSSVFDRVKKLSKKRGKKLFNLSLVQEADNTKFGNFPLIEVFVMISSCSCGSLARTIQAHVPLITLTEYEISLGVRTWYGGAEWNTEEVEEESENDPEIVSTSTNQVMEYKQRLGNSWYGLEVAAGCNEVSGIEEGSEGIASGYSHESR